MKHIILLCLLLASALSQILIEDDSQSSESSDLTSNLVTDTSSWDSSTSVEQAQEYESDETSQEEYYHYESEESPPGKRTRIPLFLYPDAAPMHRWEENLRERQAAADEAIYRDGIHVTVLLEVDLCVFDAHVHFNSRCYNGNFLGPEIRVRPGDVLNITLINRLGTETKGEAHNKLHWPNHTSLHIHGIHASPEEDNIFITANPGETNSYLYFIKDDHYPGSLWYHAHYHGNSAYQTLEGMHGSFIVEPLHEGFYPPFLSDMIELTMMISNLKIFTLDNKEWHGLEEYWTETGDDVPLNLIVGNELYNNTYLVNGLLQPTIPILLNQWYWFRITNAGGSFMIPLVYNTSGCVHFTIGLDGVFVEEPFTEEAYYIMPGCRLDLAVMCTEAGNHSFALVQPENNSWIYTGVDYSDDFLLFQLSAESDSGKTPRSIEEWAAPPKPEYLSDLVGIPDSEIAGKFAIHAWLSDDEENFLRFNDVFWKGRNESVIFELQVGKVYEIEFTSSFAVHPIHIHINHMQVVWDKESINATYDNSWPVHRVGTWRDTIYASRDRDVVIRMRPDTYSGFVLVHCHYIVHADRGMMAEIRVVDPVTAKKYV